MSEINTVSLINQMRIMAAQAKGSGVESATSTGPAFGATFQQALNQVNNLSQQSDGLKARFEMGDASVNLSDVMVASQKSTLAFEATLRVRNKVVQAYQDIMNMPV